MAKSRDINLWDGFDGREIVYDDRKEKQYHSRIWVVLGIIAGLLLLSLFWRLGTEIVYRTCGNSLEAEFVEEPTKIYARYYDENDNAYTYNLSEFFTPIHNGDKITLYYMSDIQEARPASKLTAWFGYFGFFGVIFGICVWRLYVIWHPKTHAPVEEG